MPASTFRPGEDAAVVELASFRSRRIFSPSSYWKKDCELCLDFAYYLRRRAESAETETDGLRRLAIAFDLRRIDLINSLTSMLGDRYLIDRANNALGLAAHLEEALAVPNIRRHSAAATAHQLASALDAIAAALATAHVARQ